MTEPGARTRADPVVGWRYWQLGPSGLLRSVTQRRIEWRPGRVLRAACLGAGHRAPDERCDCGIYGAADLPTLREHGLCLAPETLVVGRVALWGRVIPDVAGSLPGRSSGWRGEYAEPAHLSVVRELVLDGELDATVASLGAYGVPVDTVALADAVAGVSEATLAFQAMSARASRSRA
jgi:hypothetical protein